MMYSNEIPGFSPCELCGALYVDGAQFLSENIKESEFTYVPYFDLCEECYNKLEKNFKCFCTTCDSFFDFELTGNTCPNCEKTLITNDLNQNQSLEVIQEPYKIIVNISFCPYIRLYVYFDEYEGFSHCKFVNIETGKRWCFDLCFFETIEKKLIFLNNLIKTL